MLKRDGKNTVVVVSLVTALCLLGDSMLYIALPIYWHKVGLLSIWEVGLILSANRLIRLPLNPIIGWLYTKITLRTGLLIAVGLATMTTIGYGVGEGLVIWLILRCIWGLAWSLLRLGGFFSVISYANDQNRGYLMGLYNGLYRLGSLFGMLLGGIFASIIGIKLISIIFGLCALFSIPLIFIYVDGRSMTNQANQSKINVTPIHWLDSAVLKVILSGFLLALLIQGVFASTLSFVIEHHYSSTISLFGFLLGVTTLSGIIQGARWAWEPVLGAQIGKWSDGPKGRLPYLVKALLVSAIGYACIPWAISPYLWLLIILIVNLAATALTTLMDALTADVAKTTNAVSLMTVYSIALDFGAALGPFLAYLLLLLDYGVMYIFIGSSMIFLLISILWHSPFQRIFHKNKNKEGTL